VKLERYDPFDGALGCALAVAAGDVVHVCGTVGANDDLTLPSTVVEQMRQAYRKIAETLAHFGCSLSDVADQTVFFVGDSADALAAAAAVRAEVFGSAPPASTMVGVDKLVDPSILVEIKVTAYRA
jgi:enamine deaminase RidA (YjgF/YER057c/UK114 family)